MHPLDTLLPPVAAICLVSRADASNGHRPTRRSIGRINAFFSEVQRWLAINCPPLCRPIALSLPGIPHLPFEICPSAIHVRTCADQMGRPIPSLRSSNAPNGVSTLAFGRQPNRPARMPTGGDRLTSKIVSKWSEFGCHWACLWKDITNI